MQHFTNLTVTIQCCCQSFRFIKSIKQTAKTHIQIDETVKTSHILYDIRRYVKLVSHNIQGPGIL